jgi:hypothetical protein
VVLQLSDPRPAASCQILFVCATERNSLTVIADLKRSGILIVGETDGFAADGGVVNFKVEGGRVRLEINVTAGQQQGLRISSKLLSLAEIVGNRSPQR